MVHTLMESFVVEFWKITNHTMNSTVCSQIYFVVYTTSSVELMREKEKGKTRVIDDKMFTILTFDPRRFLRHKSITNMFIDTGICSSRENPSSSSLKEHSYITQAHLQAPLPLHKHAFRTGSKQKLTFSYPPFSLEMLT